MAVIFHHFLHSPLATSISSNTSSPSSRFSRIQISASSSQSSSSMDSQPEGRRNFIDFPFVSAPHKNLMVDLVSTLENRLDSLLLPCTLPLDVQYFQNKNATAHGSLHIRSGHHSSNIDFVLGSWLHCELPTGGALNITSLSAYLNPLTDAPNLLIEIIRSSPTSVFLILDLPPRKDLVLNPDYLKLFYEDTQLELRRQVLDKIPESRPYFSSSLYIRSVVSPTAIMALIETDTGGAEHIEEILKNQVDPIAKEVMGIWLDQCACGVREIGEEERGYLKRRDDLVKRKTIEIDLGSSMPRLFGSEIADRILEAITSVFSVTE